MVPAHGQQGKHSWSVQAASSVVHGAPSTPCGALVVGGAILVVLRRFSVFLFFGFLSFLVLYFSNLGAINGGFVPPLLVGHICARTTVKN